MKQHPTAVWLCRMTIVGTFCLFFARSAQALTISNVVITTTDHEIIATWTTDQPSTTELDYSWTSGSGGSSIGESVTSHSITVSSLQPQTAFQVTVTSKSGSTTASFGPRTVTTLADVTPPSITAVQVENVASHSAVVSWNSSEPNGSGSLAYGPTLNYGQTVSSQPLLNDIFGSEMRHRAIVSNLSAISAHQFQVYADDGYGNQAIPAGNFTLLTDSLWSQLSFRSIPDLYTSTCVLVGDAGGCTPGRLGVNAMYNWPKEMSWTGNELLIHFNAAADDLIRGALRFEVNVTYVQFVNNKWVKLELAGGTSPTSLTIINPGGVTLDHTGTYAVSVPASLFAPGLNYLRLRGITIDPTEIGPGRVAPVAVWDRMRLQFTGLASPMLTDAQLLDRTEAQAAKYFWDQFTAGNGFVRDTTNSVYTSIGATGFGLAALTVMADRFGTSAEWTVTPAEARSRAQQILDAAVTIQGRQSSDPGRFGKAGFLYHFMNASGERSPNSEVSTADAALFLAGALAAGQYFGGTVQERANQLSAAMDWTYFFDPATKRFYHGWMPEAGIGDFRVTPRDGQGLLSASQWDRPTDEAILISLLALARHPADAGVKASLYAWPRVTRSYAGFNVVNSYFGSLFTYVFGEAFLDFQALGADNPASVGAAIPSVNWFANARSAALANRQFAIDQSASFPTYSPERWGLSASYRPDGSYFGENGAKPAEFNSGTPSFDGTVPAYSAISTLPLVRNPGETLGANLAFQSLRHYQQNHFGGIWGAYGPRDSLRTISQAGSPVTVYSPLYVGIDVGPEVLMIENYRSGLVQRQLMSHPAMLDAIRQQFPNAQLNQPPVLSAIGDRAVTAGQALTFTISATDPEGGLLTYAANPLPSGASFSAATRTFSWTPTSAQAGTHPVTFTVTDAGGLRDQETITITVQASASVTIDSPAGTPTWFGGSTQTIAWHWTGTANRFSVTIYSLISGQYDVIAADLIPPVGSKLDSLNWIVPHWLSTDDYLVQVCGTFLAEGATVCGESPVHLEEAKITYLGPTTGPLLYARPTTISWTAQGVFRDNTVALLAIRIRTGAGTKAYPIAGGLPAYAGAYSWVPGLTIPAADLQPGDAVRIQISAFSVIPGKTFFASSPALAVSRPNLQVNGSFELGKTNWSGWSSYIKLATVAFDGQWAVSMNASGGKRTLYSSPYLSGVVPGKRYEASAAVQTNVTGPLGVYVEVEWRTSGGSLIRRDQFGTLVGTNPWMVRASGPLTAPSNAAKARIRLVAEKPAVAAFDAAQLYEVP